MTPKKLRETDLYPPIKAFLENQGYEVKSEIADADVVAQRDDDDPVIVELKTGFSLTLFHQAIARLGITPSVYVAVPRGKGRAFARAVKENTRLARRLGLGVITIRLSDGLVEVHCDPGPFQSRIVKPRRARLLREFARRVGDPNCGGSSRTGLVTAYRQDALRCAVHLSQSGETKGAVVASSTGVPNATRIMADDHYGWFERVRTGTYALTPKGQAALVDHDAHLKDMPPPCVDDPDRPQAAHKS